MPLVYPPGPYAEFGGINWAAGGPGGLRVAVENWVNGHVITFGGIPAVNPSTMYWALSADVVAEGNQVISAVNAAKQALHDQIAALPTPNEAVLNAIKAQLDNLDLALEQNMAALAFMLETLPEETAAILGPMLGQVEGEVLAAIEQGRLEQEELFTQLAASLAPAIEKIAALEPVTPDQLAEKLDETRQLLTDSVGEW